MRSEFESAWVERIRAEDQACTDFMARVSIRFRRADILPDILREAAKLGLEEPVIIDGWDEYRTMTINATLEDINAADQPVWSAAEAAGLKLEATILHHGNPPPTGKLTVKASWKRDGAALSQLGRRGFLYVAPSVRPFFNPRL